ncbi:MAG: HU family DNA-binding protein [Clostridiales bacterium]|nr:HU family DNA-binding protein [Clostridiales bacterium]
MNKSEMIAKIAEKTNTSRKAATEMFDAFVETVTETLKAGESVQIIGFGTFEVKERPARAGRNPATGETIEIAASKTPSFKVGKTFKSAIEE